MKEAQRSWKDITAELGRPKHELTKRWKEIQGQPVGGAAAGGEDAEKKDDGGGEKGKQQQGGGKQGKKGKQGGGGRGDGGDNAKNEGKADKKDKQQQQQKDKKKDSNGVAKESKKKSTEKPASAKAGSTRSTRSNGEARFTMDEWLSLQEDDVFSFGELQCLSEIIMKDQRLTWLRIAAAFYNKTGRRVHPDDIREKFEEMAAMSG
jgi:hypothetical protein